MEESGLVGKSVKVERTSELQVHGRVTYESEKGITIIPIGEEQTQRLFIPWTAITGLYYGDNR